MPSDVRSSAAERSVRSGFTIVELLVVAVILAVLSSLMLAGLGRVRHRAKVDKTKSTIRKLHEIVMPQYESYLRRRVPFATTTNARQNAVNRLVAIRRLMVREMPDSWRDVYNTASDLQGLPPADAYLRTSVVFGCCGAKNALATQADLAARGRFNAFTNDSSECLFAIVSRGASEPFVMEQFRDDEIGDTDTDGAPEFLDGWNQPIIFLRWAPGFSPFSMVQRADPTAFHDPLDPQRADPAGYALVPLIASGGGDRLTGLQLTTAGWAGLNLASIVGVAPQIGAPVSTAPNDYRDNITNHDFSVR